jgi:ubiquinone/menaquinone biosynthesis C-methylase UbiE
MSDQRLPDETISYYDAGKERDRLQAGASRIELTRTQDILRRVLPSAPAHILDIGGGPGAYAAWLAREGYEVQLLDPVPLHVEQATDAASHQPDRPFSAMQGDARALPYADRSADVALLLGPLYHLTERTDRLQALREARRVLRPGGVVAAAAISRFTSLLDGLWRGYLDDPDFVQIVERDLRDGQHRNPSNHPGYFTTAYFHHPDELAEEIMTAGLELESVRAIEGPAWLIPDLDHWWENDTRRERLLAYLASVEREPSLVGASAHMLAIATAPTSVG